ncbi:TIGR03857 family LLM class F420-dependent oxidoreductase [Patulibacter minatonensis]|uniref:TIGR03857 family LLM class F420-dependent oxidoreductase n=1 Tax=Patulibacter minatonensis TaxID=298163 RepID=UPI0004BA576F|nr:TIGR03857 family LLM class F420-dependent oxidoreductase [Patulibacter minatonensis]
MSSADAGATATSADLPLIPELGIYLLPGRVKDPSRALDEAAEAERLGFRTVWLSERYDLKDAGVLLGAIAARTSRVTIATASVNAGARAPIMSATMGATLQESFGARFRLGIARGLPALLRHQGLPHYDSKGFEEYCSVVKRLWDGETVEHDGALGVMTGARLADPLTAPRPELVLVSWVPGPKAIAMAARTFDGVLLGSELTVEATRTIVGRLRAACEEIGRDPDSLRLYMTVIAAPGLPEEEELAVVHARVISHLGFGGVGRRIVEANGWDPAVMEELSRRTAGIDQKAHRHEMLDLARSLPREWIETSTAVGSPAEVARRLREYLDAGLDEICIHGASPFQCAGLVEAWHAGGDRT